MTHVLKAHTKKALKRAAKFVAVALIALVAGYWISLYPAVANTINSILWVISNLLVGYISAALIVFVVGYYFLFDPRATTAGKFVFRFMVALLGAMGLIYIGIFINPAPGRAPFDYAGDIYWWRPVIRFLVYTYVAYSTTSLAVLLVIRKYFPHMLKTTLDYEVVKTRKETHK